LEVIGDRWSLLIVRDMMVRSYSTFKEFQHSGEGIATNILADRLGRLQRTGIVSVGRNKTDGRSIRYRLTKKGIALAPVLLEALIWGARNESSDPPNAVIRYMQENRDAFLAEVHRRWRERDPRPFQVNGRWILEFPRLDRSAK